MKKYKFFVDFAKEEAWLDSMAQQGYFLVNVSSFGGYTFVEDKPQKFDYRIDYRTFRRHSDFDDYVQMFEDSGWHHVSGTKNSGIQYFVRTRPDVESDIFSDSASKAGRYLRYSKTWLVLTAVYALFLVGSLLNGSFSIDAFLNPQDLYFTPGLWEKTGFDFIRAFLFETPFALGRGFFWVILLVIVVYFAYLAIRLIVLGRKLRYEESSHTA